MRFTLFIFLFFLAARAIAQDDLLDELQSEQPKRENFAIQTFKGSRVVNSHSVETRPKGTLEFIISHRFGTLNSGGYELWGLDISTIRLGLEYGITDRLGVGIGRSTSDKTYDFFAKYKSLRQSETFPFTLTGVGTMAIRTNRDFPANSTADKLSYTLQPLIARKFSPGFSLQLSPTWVHRNTLTDTTSVRDLYALGIGPRVRLTRSMAVNGEYFLRLNAADGTLNDDAIGLCFEIETGGHVFYLIFTNSIGMIDRRLVAETSGRFFEGDIHFGFNITRLFQIANRGTR